MAGQHELAGSRVNWAVGQAAAGAKLLCDRGQDGCRLDKVQHPRRVGSIKRWASAQEKLYVEGGYKRSVKKLKLQAGSQTAAKKWVTSDMSMLGNTRRANASTGSACPSRSSVNSRSSSCRRATICGPYM